MANTSNGHFLPLLPSPPLPGAGWSVKVYGEQQLDAYAHGRNPVPLTQIFRYLALTCSPEVSGVGAGSITLSLADPVFSYALADGRAPEILYERENLWVVLQDGQWRGEFWGTQRELTPVSAGEAAGRVVTISGSGAAQALDRDCVLSPYYPKTAPKGKIGVYQFKNVPVMASWLHLLAAAQRRRSVPYIRCRFDAVRDTGGVKWEDTPTPKPKNTATATVGDVMFDFDSSALNSAGQAAVTAIVAKLAKVTYPQVRVVGHASSEGSQAYNYQKALDRADTVRNAILTAVPLAQVTSVSKGETQPVASNRTAAGRAKNRRVVVTYQSAAAYADTVFTPERGTTLLDLLTQLTSGQTSAENRGPIHCEWIMTKGFELRVHSRIGRPRLGADRSKQVVFHEGSTYLPAKTTTFDSSKVANLFAVQNDLSAYKVAASAASSNAWGQRVQYTRLEGSYADTIHAMIANTQREAYAEQNATLRVTIVPGPGRTPFRDFGLGDWIGLMQPRGRQPGLIDRQRVMAVTVAVDADGTATYELTLSSARATRLALLQLQVDSLINRKRGIRSFIQDDEPTGGLPGDLWTPAFSSDV